MSRSFKKFKPKVSKISDTKYYFDFPTEPIGGENPYYRCVYCKRSVPEINGDLKKHSEFCKYRIEKDSDEDI